MRMRNKPVRTEPKALKSIAAALAGVLLALTLTGARPARAEDSLQNAAAAMKSAGTLNSRLALLQELSVTYSDELDAGGWDTDLNFRLTETLPEDLLPREDMREEQQTAADYAGAKFIALFDDDGVIRLLGDYQARIPEALRASSLEEADAVLCLVHRTVARSDYTASAYNRDYSVIVYRRGGGTRTTLAHKVTKPPAAGYGTLYGDPVAPEDLWDDVRTWFYGFIELTTPLGTATFRVLGRTCCLDGLKGSFLRYEVPAEVEGHPVAGIRWCDCDAEELVLPEGIEWIGYIGGNRLRRITFPSTLKRITGGIGCKGEILLNEGLEELGDNVLQQGRGSGFALPSTLKTLGAGVLKYGADCPSLAVPEGVRALPDGFLMEAGRVLCVYLPAGLTGFGSCVLEHGIRIYAPAGSAAAEWAQREGYDFVPCARAEDMPLPVYGEQDGFSYATLAGEAILTGSSGSGYDERVQVPAILGGCPVTVIRKQAFYERRQLGAVLFPNTVRKIGYGALWQCDVLKAVFIPASVTNLHPEAVLCPRAQIFVVPGSPAEAVLAEKGTPYEIWTAEAKEAWFPAAGAK